MQKVPHSESDLLHLLASGDEQAYRLIFDQYWDPVYSTALLLTKSSALAEDVAQDVFTVLWEKRAGMAAVEKLEAFLFIMARNLIYTRLRKLASAENYLQYIRHCFPETAIIAPQEQVEVRELEKTIMTAIQHLPPQQQRAFKMSRFEGLRHEEIAVQMGVSRITIKSYIVQAIASLRKAVANYPSGAIVALLTFLRNFF